MILSYLQCRFYICVNLRDIIPRTFVGRIAVAFRIEIAVVVVVAAFAFRSGGRSRLPVIGCKRY